MPEDPVFPWIENGGGLVDGSGQPLLCGVYPCGPCCDRIKSDEDGGGSYDDWVWDDVYGHPFTPWTGHLHWDITDAQIVYHSGPSDPLFPRAGMVFVYKQDLETRHIKARAHYSTTFPLGEYEFMNAIGNPGNQIVYTMGLHDVDASPNSGVQVEVTVGHISDLGYRDVRVAIHASDAGGSVSVTGGCAASALGGTYYNDIPLGEYTFQTAESSISLDFCLDEGDILTVKTNDVDGMSVSTRNGIWQITPPNSRYRFCVGAAVIITDPDDTLPIPEDGYAVDIDNVTLQIVGDDCEACERICRYCEDMNYPEEASIDMSDVWNSPFGSPCGTSYPSVPTGSFSLNADYLGAFTAIGGGIGAVRRVTPVDYGTSNGSAICPAGTEIWSLACNVASTGLCSWKLDFETPREWPGTAFVTGFRAWLGEGTIEHYGDVYGGNNVTRYWDGSGFDTRYQWSPAGTFGAYYLWTAPIPLVFTAAMIGYVGDTDPGGLYGPLVQGYAVIGTGTAYGISELGPGDFYPGDATHGSIVPAVSIYRRERPQIGCSLDGIKMCAWYTCACAAIDLLPQCGPSYLTTPAPWTPPGCAVKLPLVTQEFFGDSEEPCNTGVDWKAFMTGGLM